MCDYDFFPFFSMPHGGGWVFMILFWTLVIVGVVAIVRWLAGSASRQQKTLSLAHKTSTDNILRERYARGEIEQEEFLQRLEDLNGR